MFEHLGRSAVVASMFDGICLISFLLAVLANYRVTRNHPRHGGNKEGG